MDNCQISVNTFNTLADNYAQKYFALSTYDGCYRIFCSQLSKKGGSVLDVACGPGNVANFLVRERPDLEVTGIDLAPRMIQLAKTLVPTANFLAHDCRHLSTLSRVYDGIVYAFGLNYLNQQDTEQVFDSIPNVLALNGTFYLSVMLGSAEQSGIQTSSSGNQVYIYYRPRQEIERLVRNAGLELIYLEEFSSPSNAPTATIDLVLIARRIK
ncbi:class I SAM-dependent methyltransferase [Solimicrobium silvestre]|uniref:Methyltransferase domain n=1 Tax=Solimicrobium silvestre TaxID=2099400 RepID=A0A2S9GVU4_9BURK|nr:class I SAM-dependent methyltransferase [Solimicrobium silvestre]PRC91843.1 Methyltransferase domain [Solimicrobium silvestre]